MKALLLLSYLSVIAAQQLVPQKEPFPTGPKYVIGHRGDAGYVLVIDLQ